MKPLQFVRTIETQKRKKYIINLTPKYNGLKYNGLKYNGLKYNGLKYNKQINSI